jgi:hypothetical protein
VDEEIEEMVELCNELLNSDILTDSLNDPIMVFASHVDALGNQSIGMKIPSKKIISCL